MSENIREAVPKVLKTLWDLENDLRAAARNSVVFRREEASHHLAEARQHLDRLMSLVRSSEGAKEGVSAPSAEPDVPPAIKH